MLKTRRTKRTFFPEFKLEAIEQLLFPCSLYRGLSVML